MSTVTCLRCKEVIDGNAEQCPHCSERVTSFQRTYASRLLDGKYQIIDRLGIGGMGEIFKVRHIHLNELRVIKIMRPNVAADDQGLQRFLQEARTSTMIKHKNLAMLYDFSTLEDGSYYMVWEFIDGTNIQKWIAQNGPIPARLAIEMSVQALIGLDHLHSMGLIHRDISPENIMLSQDHHGKLLVKVIDFGIAKQLAEGEGGQGLTQTGMFLGKLKYASPEQAGFLKEDEHLDARSDLYSFGIVMYEMLAGRAPFQATNPHGYILKHVTEKPLPIHELNPAVTVPPQLESIIQKSLEKSRDARYATAADFAAALEAIRNTIQPDQKYGLGERMVTLSGAQTLADLPKMPTGAYTGGSTQQTMGANRTAPAQKGPVAGPTGTRQGSDDATVMEPGLKVSTMPGRAAPNAEAEATVMERKTIGSDEATVMENFGSPNRTVAGAPRSGNVANAGNYGGGNADATVIERQIDMRPSAAAAPKKNAALLGAIAAAVVIALLAGGYFMRRKPSAPVVATTTAVPSGAQVTATPPNANALLATGQGALLLSASPWGELEKIVSSDNKAVDLSDDKRSTPTRIDLDPGRYTVTLNGPKGPETFDVEIKAGEKLGKHETLGAVDYNELEKEMNRQ
jgi:serine/threonine protein kinase